MERAAGPGYDGTMEPSQSPDRAPEDLREPRPAGRDGRAADRGAEPDRRGGGGLRPAGGDPHGRRVRGRAAAAGHPRRPAVAVRFDSGRPGRTLQFDGHLDTVHLPFVPPRVEDGRITGSGASDMKGGIAAAVEALRALRDAGALTAGSVLLTAHDLHEAPWGDGQQLDQLIARRATSATPCCSPSRSATVLPVAGRGSATLEGRRSAAPGRRSTR